MQTGLYYPAVSQALKEFAALFLFFLRHEKGFLTFFDYIYNFFLSALFVAHLPVKMLCITVLNQYIFFFILKCKQA